MGDTREPEPSEELRSVDAALVGCLTFGTGGMGAVALWTIEVAITAFMVVPVLARHDLWRDELPSSVFTALAYQSLLFALGLAQAESWTSVHLERRGLVFAGWGRRALVPWGAIRAVSETVTAGEAHAAKVITVSTRTRVYRIPLDVVDRRRLVEAVLARCPSAGARVADAGALMTWRRPSLGLLPASHYVLGVTALWLGTFALALGVGSLRGASVAPPLAALAAGGLVTLGGAWTVLRARRIELEAPGAPDGPTVVASDARAPHGARCPYCLDDVQDDLDAGGGPASCERCGATYHAECLAELSGRCGILACGGQARRRVPS